MELWSNGDLQRVWVGGVGLLVVSGFGVVVGVIYWGIGCYLCGLWILYK